MASRRARGRSPGRGRFEKQEEFLLDERGAAPEELDSLSARERIRRENEMFDHFKDEIFDHLKERGHSRSRRPVGRSGDRDSSRARSRKSRSPRRRADRDDGGNGRSSRSGGGERRNRSRDRGYDRHEEKLRFEPPTHFVEDTPEEEDLRSRIVGRNRFSPPAEMEFDKPIYVEEGFVEHSGYHHRGSAGASEQLNVSHDEDFDARNSSIPSLMERPVFPIGPNVSGGSSNAQQNFTATPRKQDVSDDEPLIPEYNPELSKMSSYDWIKLIEDTAKQYDWQKDEKQYILASRLSGYARQWYLNTGIKYKNWNELKHVFLQAFPTEMNFYTLLTKMISRTKENNETLSTYFHHKVALLNACEIHGRKAVSCIIGGLQSKSLQMDAKNENFEDPDELYSFLRTFDSEPVRPEVGGGVPPPSSSSSKQDKDGPFPHKKCFICKEVGHIKAQCPHRSKLATEGRTPSNGDIPQLLNSNKVMFGSLSRKAINEKNFTEVNINGITLKAYVDQTSESTTIRQTAANQLKLQVKKEYKVIRGFAGCSFSSVGVADVVLCIDGAFANTQLSVVPDHLQAVPVIVGQSFSKLPKVVVVKEGERVRFYQRMDNGKSNYDY